MQTMNKLSIICPTFAHDGESLLPIIHAIAKEVAMVTGGVSTQDAHAGTWYDINGAEYSEPSVVLWTIADDDTLKQLEARFEEWRVGLQQISLLVISEKVTATFIENQVKQEIQDVA